MNPLEVYVLCGERSFQLAQKFLGDIAAKRSPVAEDYPFPEFSDEPTHTFMNPNDLIQLLEIQKNEPYSIYWNVEDGVLGEQVMLVFTEDGGMVAGIGGPTKSAEETLVFLGTLVNGRFGYISSGSCPPDTRKEFIEICEQSTLANLFEGKLRASS